MFITEDQARARLESENNLANRFKKPDEDCSVLTESILTEKENPENTSSNNSSNSPIEIREIKGPGRNKDSRPYGTKLTTEIAIRAKLGEKQEKLAQEFGTAQSHISSIKNGKVKSVDEQAVDLVIGEVRDKALDRLMSSLGLLTDDKLSGCSAKDLSAIAANMGRVVEKTNPKSDSPDKINLIIYSPELKNEKSFNIVEI